MKNIPIKFKGVDIRTGKTVFGLYYVTPLDRQPAILQYGLSGYPVCTLVKPDSIRQLVGYDTEGHEVFEGEKVFCYSGFCTPAKELKERSPLRKARVELIGYVSAYDENFNSPFDYQFLKCRSDSKS